MPDSTAHELPQIFDISSVSEVKSTLTVALGAGDAVPLDGEPVQRIDASALQLLCAFRRAAERRGVDVVWTRASDVLIEAATTTGMLEVLGLEARAAK